jgi:uncharacterized protein YbbK (DUF523 family)
MIYSEKIQIRIGISSCLLGEKVRFDASHKKDRYLTDILHIINDTIMNLYH